MKILLSPTKKMRREEVLTPWGEPLFLNNAKQVIDSLKALTPEERRTVWHCSEKLAKENEERLAHMDLCHGISPALFSYCGLAFTHIAPDALEDDALAYLQDHLRILSAVYGVLKPMDGIVSYRLEMEVPLSVQGSGTLYDYWNDRLARHLEEDDDVIVNLASKEYADAVCPHLSRARCIQIEFLHEHNGKFVTKATYAKMARGDMVQWLARNQIEDVNEIRRFAEGYRFDESSSDENRYIFLMMR